MAGDYVLEEAAVAPRLDKSLKFLIILAVIILSGILVWLVGIAPFRAFSKIDVTAGDSRYAKSDAYFGISREDILSTAGITRASTYFSTDAKKIEKVLAGFVSLESVRVFKHFPDRLQIVLEGRRAVGYTMANLNGRTVPVLFDGQGVIFQVGNFENDESLLLTLPVISGLVIEDPVPGMRFPAAFMPFFRELEKIESSAPELIAAVSELRISPKSFDGFDVILYPVHKKLKVHLSAEINEELLRYTLLMVDILATKEPGIESLDFRSGIASYIPLEVSPEQ